MTAASRYKISNVFFLVDSSIFKPNFPNTIKFYKVFNRLVVKFSSAQNLFGTATKETRSDWGRFSNQM